ncbi:trypsin-like peptidase domain-containing protein [Mesorhizobium sp. M1B.F.Ca.ET.045.04.1.1]|uniref:trypsin-like peptidase domain-containing protein n=1 Tax=Mesorhizobium sp. M1B.F.Ca.ET.045.04.1.1 TaxID=2493673 RepID=UPI000F75E113|nr:trypsin-like peptidase domain-containing protein [Mesorhizobium sp. M1B.F.Ca.ET.045.04.1.1]AZO29998.1 serine protease [Mesorhizobium sp. M1B.F.Ca.ET.045.04.1.1]
MPNIDKYSVSTVPLEMFFNQTNLSQGTGFIWQTENDFFLITNWHNVSGKNPFTGKHLSNTLAEPNIVRAWWNVRGQLGSKRSVDHPLRDNNDRPLWFVHPAHGRKVDVVALPVSPNDHLEAYPITAMEQIDLQIEIGMDVFVLGYPFGIAQQGGLPIWKRASLASEPEVAGAGGDLHMLLDTASRPGMSGSPIIRRSWGTALMANGGVGMMTGSATKFVGVYSGRIMAQDPLDAQLGIGWPASLVGEIVAGKRGDDP